MVARERILLAEARETNRQLDDQISLFKNAVADSANELKEQTLASLESASDRLGEINNELQTAIQEKIKLSRSNLRGLRHEMSLMMDQIESTGKLVLA